MENKKSAILSFTPPQIIDYQWYQEHYTLPTTPTTEQQAYIEKIIVQAQDQIDTLCNGRVYEEYPTLDIENDKMRIYYLQKAIGDLVEYYFDTGKLFVNKSLSTSGNVVANLSTSSNDANFERLRLDIIKKLIQAGFYQSYSLGELNNNCKSVVDNPEWYEQLVARLNLTFKRLDNDNAFSANVNINGNTLSNVDNISAVFKQNPENAQTIFPTITSFDLVNCLWNGEELDLKGGFNPDTIKVLSVNGNINNLSFYINNSGASLIDDLIFNSTVTKLEQQIQDMTPAGYDDLVAQVQANTEAIGNINDVNEQQNAKIATNQTNIATTTTHLTNVDNVKVQESDTSYTLLNQLYNNNNKFLTSKQYVDAKDTTLSNEINSLDDRVTALEDAPTSESIADGVYVDTPNGIVTLAEIDDRGLVEQDYRLATTYTVDEAIQKTYLHYIRQLQTPDSLYLTNGENWTTGANYRSALTFTHNNNNNNVLGWKTTNGLTIIGNENMYLEGANVNDVEIINNTSVVNKKYVDDKVNEVATFLSEKPIIKYDFVSRAFYVYIPQSWSDLPSRYWSNLYLVPVYYTHNKQKNNHYNKTDRWDTYSKDSKLRIMCNPQGNEGLTKSPYYQLFQVMGGSNALKPNQIDMRYFYKQITSTMVGKWTLIAYVNNTTNPTNLLMKFLARDCTNYGVLQNSNTMPWLKGRYNSGYRFKVSERTNNTSKKPYLQMYVNMGWAFYKSIPQTTMDPFAVDYSKLSPPTMCSWLWQMEWQKITSSDPLYVRTTNYNSGIKKIKFY